MGDLSLDRRRNLRFLLLGPLCNLLVVLRDFFSQVWIQLGLPTLRFQVIGKLLLHFFFFRTLFVLFLCSIGFHLILLLQLTLKQKLQHFLINSCLEPFEPLEERNLFFICLFEQGFLLNVLNEHHVGTNNFNRFHCLQNVKLREAYQGEELAHWVSFL